MKITISILSKLLFHANKEPYFLGDKKSFYERKSKLLKRYGAPLNCDIQFIDGKKCYNCDGSGKHYFFNNYIDGTDWETCWDCNGDGWYKNPQYNLLQRVQFGKYVFHQPLERFYEESTLRTYCEGNNLEIRDSKIDGYIEHDNPNKFSMHLFFILYFTKGYWQRLGRGYFINWWHPYRFLSNVVGLFKSSYIRKSTIKAIVEWWPIKKKLPFDNGVKYEIVSEDDDLPF